MLLKKDHYEGQVSITEKVAYGTGDGFTIEEVQLCNVT